MKFGFDWPSGFGEKIFENGGRTPDDDGACLYYKLRNEPKGSGELKINFLFPETSQYFLGSVHKQTILALFFFFIWELHENHSNYPKNMMSQTNLEQVSKMYGP